LAVAWAQQPASSLKSEFRVLAGSLEGNSVPAEPGTKPTRAARAFGKRLGKFNHPIRGEFHEKTYLDLCSAAAIIGREHRPRAIFIHPSVRAVNVPS
jgi:hypothetical protein